MFMYFNSYKRHIVCNISMIYYTLTILIEKVFRNYEF